MPELNENNIYICDSIQSCRFEQGRVRFLLQTLAVDDGYIASSSVHAVDQGHGNPLSTHNLVHPSLPEAIHAELSNIRKTYGNRISQKCFQAFEQKITETFDFSVLVKQGVGVSKKSA